MKKTLGWMMCWILLGPAAGPSARADQDEAARDLLKIEKVTAGGATVTVVPHWVWGRNRRRPDGGRAPGAMMARTSTGRPGVTAAFRWRMPGAAP